MKPDRTGQKKISTPSIKTFATCTLRVKSGLCIYISRREIYTSTVLHAHVVRHKLKLDNNSVQVQDKSEKNEGCGQVKNRHFVLFFVLPKIYQGDPMKQQVKPHNDKEFLLLELELEGLPPTVNHLYRTSRSGFRYKTERGRKYQEQISSLLAEKWQSRAPYSGDIELRIEFTVKTRRKWDIDNRVKALQDCLSMAKIIEDDSQVQILHVERRKGEADMTRLEIWRLQQ